MTTILHLSDTHFGTEVPAVIAALQQTAVTLHPDVVIVTGDITQRARKHEFSNAAAFIEALPAQVRLVIPGNHDIPLYNVFARFFTPYRNFRRAFGARQNVWHNKELGIACFDATNRWRHTRGKLREEQIRRLMDQLSRQLPEDAVRIVCAHQPLVTAWAQDTHETLIGRGLSAEILSRAGADLVLSGHVHVPLLATTQLHFPTLSRHFVLAGAGTATSHRVRKGAPNSFNVIRTLWENTNAALSITHHSYDTAQARFVAHHPVHFTRLAEGWKENAS